MATPPPNMTGVPTPSRVRPLYYDMDGFRLSAAFNLDRFRSCVNYKAREGDLFIATYPKCGTTWLQEMCYLILNDGEPPASHLQRLIDTPFFDMLGAECVEHMRRPGAIKTHLPFNLIPYAPHAKYVYVIRNPKDCVVSFYYHTAKTYPGYMFTDGTFSEFFDLFMEGQTDFGSYSDHVRSWHRHRHLENIHFIYFEDIKKNGPEEILKLARFLGKEYEAKLKAGLLEKVIEGSSIKKMKEDYKEFELDKDDEKLPDAIRHFAVCNQTGSAGGEADSSGGVIQFKGHVRKGEINDWKNHFTPEQNERIETMIQSDFSEEFPEVIARWREHGVFDALPAKASDN